MKKSIYTKLSLTFLVLLVAIAGADAQKLKMKKGKFEELKGQSTVNVEFDYSDMAVGKFKEEKKYTDKKVTEKNEDEAGTGDIWLEAWVADRENRFEPKFLELFNKHVEEKGLEAVDTDEEAKYTLIVHTVFTEPGFNIGIMRRNASINVVFSLKDNSSGKIVSEGKMDKIQGSDAMGFDFDTGQRLAEAYAKGGKSLAKHMSKKVL